MRLIDMQPYIQLDNLPGEIWKEHQYFSNLFVSTFGRIKRSGNKYTIKNGGYNIVNDHILNCENILKDIIMQNLSIMEYDIDGMHTDLQQKLL